MSLHLSLETHEIAALPDSDGERAKRRAVFLADLIAPGGTSPSDLDPHNWETVTRPVAGDVSPHMVQLICKNAGVELSF